jgi:hypothetical protein
VVVVVVVVARGVNGRKGRLSTFKDDRCIE